MAGQNVKKDRKPALFAPRSFKRSMFTALLMMIIALLAVLLFYIFGIVRKSYRQTQALFLQSTAEAQERLENALEEARLSAWQAAYSGAVQNVLLSGNPETVILSRNMAIDAIEYAVNETRLLQGVVLYAANGRRLSSGTQNADIADLAMEACGLTNSSVMSEAVLSPPVSFSGRSYYVSLYPIYGTIDGARSKNNQIILAVIIAEDDFRNTLPLAAFPGAAAVLRSAETKQLILSTRELTQKEAELAADPAFTPGEEALRSGTSLVSCRTLATPFNPELLYVMPLNFEGNFNVSFENLPVILIMLFILLIAVMIYRILYAINRDVNTMVQDIRAIENGADSISTPRIEELSVISNTLNDTLSELHQEYEREQNLLTMNYEAELAQNRAELLAYRSQINPHFLFNTLESARSLAHHYKVAPVEQLISGMSRMFQSSLYSPMIIPLREELEALDGYISVIEVRFPGRYTIKKKIDEDTLSHPVLSVLLQPLLENTIQHAFTGRRTGEVLITSAYEDETRSRLKITMTDNGIGMSEETLDAIVFKMKNSMEDTASIHADEDRPWLIDSNRDLSIGLANIYRRLKLTFGEHAHIRLRSQKDHYTSVELLIPFREDTQAF